MFKGSPGYPVGEVDRLTQAWGGSNNAYTTHESTVYTFSFSGDRWREALSIEADRLGSLTLPPAELERERGVILEEIGLYEDQPWDLLEKRVHAEHFGALPYGRPIAGERESVTAVSGQELADFHRRFYGAANAVLVVAGDLAEDALDEVRRRFEQVRPGEAVSRRQPGPSRPRGLRRLEQRKGEVARLLLALPAPDADDPDYAALRLLFTVLAGGRCSRLGQELVEDGQLCSGCSAELSESQGPGVAGIWAELTAAAEPPAVEEVVLAELERIRREPPSADELERARNLLMADWAFGIETVGEQAMVMGLAASLFDLEYPVRHLRRLLEADGERLAEVADRYLDAGRDGVVGWSLPGGESE